MKKSIFVILAGLAVVAVLASCESQSGKKVREAKVSQLKAERAPAQDTLCFHPEEIGVTELVKEFTPYPGYDGGTGMKISFLIGIRHGEKIYEVQCSEGKFFRDNVTKEEAMRDQSLALVDFAHDLLEIMPESDISIVSVNEEIVKISRDPKFDDNGKFIPSQVIWEKNN